MNSSFSKKIVGHKAFNAEQIMLDASFTRLAELFEQYQVITEKKINDLSEALQSANEKNAALQQQYEGVVSSIKEITVLPDEHQWSQQVKLMKEEINQLLSEVHDFIEYAEDKRSDYFKYNTK